jgi:hypothetical protein
VYSTSAAFKALMAQPSRIISVKGNITYPDAATQALTAAEISSFSVTEDAGTHIPIGGVSASTLTIKLDNRDGEWNPGGSILGSHSLDGAIIDIQIGVGDPLDDAFVLFDGGIIGTTYEGYLDGGDPGDVHVDIVDGGFITWSADDFSWCNIGTFVLEGSIGQEQDVLITLKGADYLGEYGGTVYADTLTYPQTVIQILTHAATQAGITLGSTSFTNSTVSIQTKPNWTESTTCRDVISFVACLAGGFARIDRDGELEIVLLDDGLDYSLNGSRYVTLERQGITYGPFNALNVYPYEAPNGTAATRTATNAGLTDTEHNSITIQGNPILAYGSTALSTLMTNLHGALAGLTFVGSKFTWQGDPSITTGDLVRVTDLSSATVDVLVLSQTITFGPGFAMGSGNTLNTVTKGSSSSAYQRIFTSTGKINAQSVEGDLTIRAGEKLTLASGSDMDILSGGNLNVEAGGNVDVETDNFAIKNSDGEFLLAVSSASGGDPGGQLVVGSETMPMKIGGNFTLPIEYGGTGQYGPAANVVRFFGSYPDNNVGNNGDLGVFVNMSSGNYTAISFTHYTTVSGNDTFCGLTRNWNSIDPTGWTKIGNANATGTSNLFAAAWSFTFTDPDTMTRLAINFDSAKYLSSVWYGWNVSSYLTVAVASAAGAILGSTTFLPAVAETKQTINIEVALEDDTTYYLLIYDNTTSATKSKAIVEISTVTSPAFSVGYNCGLFVRHGGIWTLLSSGSG